jgi:hypothetical protein
MVPSLNALRLAVRRPGQGFTSHLPSRGREDFGSKSVLGHEPTRRSERTKSFSTTLVLYNLSVVYWFSCGR